MADVAAPDGGVALVTAAPAAAEASAAPGAPSEGASPGPAAVADEAHLERALAVTPQTAAAFCFAAAEVPPQYK